MGRVHAVALGVQSMDRALEVHVPPAFTMGLLRREIERAAPALADTTYAVRTWDGALLTVVRDERGQEVPHAFDECFAGIPRCFLVYPLHQPAPPSPPPPPPPPEKNDTRARIMCVRFVRGTMVTPFRSRHMFVEFFERVAALMSDEALAAEMLEYASRVAVAFPIKSGTPELVEVQRAVHGYLLRFYNPSPAMLRHDMPTGKLGMDVSKRSKRVRV